MKTLEIWLLALLAVFAPIKAVLITSLVLVSADFITGIWAAWRRGEKITSARMKESVIKACIYEVAVVFAFLAEHFLIGDLIPATKLIAALIGLVELRSILENLDSVNGAPVFATIINKLGSKKDEN